MRDLLVTLIIFGSLPYILVRPHIGVLMWTWIGLMNPHRLAYGFAATFPFAQIVAIVLLASFFVSREPKKIPWTATTVVWLIFFLWTMISTFVALVPEAAEVGWSQWWKINLMLLITLMLMRDQERINQLVWVVVLSLAFYGVKGGLFTLVSGGQYRMYGPDGSFFEDNNELGLVLIMTLPLIRYLHMEASARWLKWGLGASMVLTGITILGTHSRGAFVGLLVMVTFLVVKTKNKLLMGLAILLLLPIGFSFMPQEWTDRMQSIEHYEKDTSAMGRINAWWFAYNLAVDRPLFGGGFGTFHWQLFYKYAPDPEDFHDAHSIYFEVLAEQGIVGFILFILLGVLAYRTGSWIIKQSRGYPELSWASNLAAMVQVSIVGFAVSGLFLGVAYFDLYYLLVGMLVLMRKLVEERITGKVQDKEIVKTRTFGADTIS